MALEAVIRLDGTVFVEGEEVGTLNGFDFIPSLSQGEKVGPILTAARKILPKEIERRVRELLMSDNAAFKFNNDVNRDSSSLNELDKITIGELKEVLSRTLSVDSQRNVTVLLYADGIPFPDRVESSFDDLSVWKQSKTYK